MAATPPRRRAERPSGEIPGIDDFNTHRHEVRFVPGRHDQTVGYGSRRDERAALRAWIGYVKRGCLPCHRKIHWQDPMLERAQHLVVQPDPVNLTLSGVATLHPGHTDLDLQHGDHAQVQ